MRALLAFAAVALVACRAPETPPIGAARPPPALVPAVADAAPAAPAVLEGPVDADGGVPGDGGATGASPADAGPQVSVCDPPAERPSVVAFEGNLYACLAGGGRRQLTFDGADWDPSPSPDGARVVFMRRAGKQHIRRVDMDIADARVMLLDLAGGVPFEIARNDEATGCLSLAEPRFADEGSVVVSSYGYGLSTIHNRAVCVVDLAGPRRIHLLGLRTRCALLLTAGRFKGAFFVDAMGFRPGQGLYDEPRIVDRRGRVLKTYVETPFAVDFDGDGSVSDRERSPGCVGDPPLPRGPLEALEKGL